MIDKLFVYGSLMPGRKNHHILQSIEGNWQRASIKGTLHKRGWGSKLGFPGIILSDKGNIVNGYIFTSDKLRLYLERLDHFEGNEYKRVIAQVFPENGPSISAFVYVLRN